MKIYAKFILIVFTAILFNTTASANMGGSALELKTLNVDSVSIGATVAVEFSAYIGFPVSDVSGWISPGEGYEIISQPSFRGATMKRGDSATFVGQIRPTKLGTWKVEFEARFALGDQLNCADKSSFYIHLSDTLNRTFTAIE